MKVWETIAQEHPDYYYSWKAFAEKKDFCNGILCKVCPFDKACKYLLTEEIVAILNREYKEV